MSSRITQVPEIWVKQRPLLETFPWTFGNSLLLLSYHMNIIGYSAYEELLNQAELSPWCNLFLDTKFLEYYLNCEIQKLKKYITISILRLSSGKNPLVLEHTKEASLQLPPKQGVYTVGQIYWELRKEEVINKWEIIEGEKMKKNWLVGGFFFRGPDKKSQKT